MTDFNYDQFPLDLLRHEDSRIMIEIASLEYRRHLIGLAIGKQALETTTDLQLFTLD